MKKIRLFILLMYIMIQANFGQQLIRVEQARGSYIIPAKSDISEKTAFEKALNEAKLDAMRKAGVAENISSADVLTTNQKGANFKQDLSSILSVEISGAVVNDSIIEEKKIIGEFGQTIVYTTISADVIKYETKADPSFNYTVEGLKEYYENDNMMRFSFLPYSDGYLRIFNINDNENFMVYPFFEKTGSMLNDTLNKVFKANVKLQFPLNKLMGNPTTREEGYMLYTELPRENNYLIFVYTKENIPYTDPMTFKNVISWIYRITTDRRRVQFFDFVIVNKK